MSNWSWKEWSVTGFVLMMAVGLMTARASRSSDRAIVSMEDSYDMFDREEKKLTSGPKVQHQAPQQPYAQAAVRKVVSQNPRPADVVPAVTNPPPAPPVVGPPTPLNGKVAKIDTKKKIAEATAKKKAAALAKAKKDKATQVAAQKKARDQQVAGQDTQKAADWEKPATAAAPASAETGAAPYVPGAVAVAAGVSGGANVQADDSLTPGQWFSLLQSAPTAANGAKFKAAKAELGDKDYYEVIAKLLVDSQSDRQKLGYNLLAGDYSTATFYFLVKPPTEVQKNEKVMTALATLQKTYNKDKSRFAILATALNQKDTVIVMAAETLIAEAIKTRTPADTGAQGSTTGTTVTTLVKNDFLIFKTGLTRLMKSPTAEIAAGAKDIYGSIWQDGAVAAATAATTPTATAPTTATAQNP